MLSILRYFQPYKVQKHLTLLKNNLMFKSWETTTNVYLLDEQTNYDQAISICPLTGQRDRQRLVSSFHIGGLSLPSIDKTDHKTGWNPSFFQIQRFNFCQKCSADWGSWCLWGYPSQNAIKYAIKWNINKYKTSYKPLYHLLIFNQIQI